MNEVVIQKFLCDVGAELDRDLDQLLVKQRQEYSTKRADEIYALLKMYFRHRKDCYECNVRFVFGGHDEI